MLPFYFNTFYYLLQSIESYFKLSQTSAMEILCENS